MFDPPGIVSEEFAQSDARACVHKERYFPSSVKLAAGQGILPAWTVLGIISADSEYVPYDDDGTNDGRRVALCILGEKVDTDNGQDPVPALAYFGGSFIPSRLVGYDSAAGVDLNARTMPDGTIYIGIAGPAGATGATGPTGPTGATGA